MFLRANEAASSVQEKNIDSRNMWSDFELDKWLNKAIVLSVIIYNSWAKFPLCLESSVSFTQLG